MLGGLAFDFFDTPRVASAFKLGVEPDTYDLQCERLIDRASADRDAISIVMLLGHLRGPFVLAQTITHAFDFICDDRFAVTAASKHNAAVGHSISDSLRCRADKVGIVAGGVGGAAAVNDLVPALAQQLNDRLFQRKASVISAN